MMSDFKTVTYRGVALEVEYIFTPYDPGVWRYADGSGQPSEPASAEILNIKMGSDDITELLEHHLEEIEKLIIEKEKR